jgi:hypothetical protein
VSRWVVVASLVVACGDNGDGPHFDGFVQVDLVGVQGIEYTAPLAIGDHTFQVQVDTGSTTTAVASSACSSCEVSPTYTAGSGAADQHATASQSYADATGWSGEVFADAASIGDSPDVRLKFAAISQQTNFFGGNVDQGILGLGPAELLQPNTTSFAAQEFAAGVDPVMAFELCTDHGTFSIGGFDPAIADGDPVFTPMLALSNDNPYFDVQLAGLGLGSASFGSASDLGVTIVDTGTTLTLLPSAAETALVDAINANAGYLSLFGDQQPIADGQCVVASDVTAAMVDAAMPPLQLALAGTAQTVTLPASRSYLFEKTAGEFCLAMSDIGTIGGPATGLSLIGDTLMSGAVTVFDVGAKRIGFAPEVGCATGSAAGSAADWPARPPGTPWWTNAPGFHAPAWPRLTAAARAGT